MPSLFPSSDLFAPELERKPRHSKRAQIWSPTQCVLDVIDVAPTPEAIARCTGLMAEMVGQALAELEQQGAIQRNGDKWRKVSQ